MGVFQKKATRYEQLHAERLKVIKKACGNAAISLITGSIFVGLSLWWHGALLSIPETPLLVLVLVLSFLLLAYARDERYGELVHRTVAVLRQEVKVFVAPDGVGLAAHNRGPALVDETSRGKN